MMRSGRRQPILVLQAWVRGLEGRRLAAVNRERRFQVLRREREFEAARSRVRCPYRRLTHWDIKMMSDEQKEAAKVLTRSVRRWLERRRECKRQERARRDAAAVILLRALRRDGVRRRKVRLREEALSLAILEFTENCAGRKLGFFMKDVKKKKRERVRAAATVITAIVRQRHAMILCDNKRHLRKEAASVLLRSWRSFASRKRATKIKIGKGRLRVLVRQKIRARRALKRHHIVAVTLIQKRSRGYVDRRRRALRVEALLLERVLVKSIFVQTAIASHARRRKATLISQRLMEHRRFEKYAFVIIALRYHAALEHRRLRIVEERQLLETQKKAASRIVAFGRVSLARIERRSREHRRAAARIAIDVQRLQRGRLGRARFEIINAESYRCRHCSGREFGGTYCKTCGYSRFVGQRPIVHIVDDGTSPYSANFKPGLVKALRTKCMQTSASLSRLAVVPEEKTNMTHHRREKTTTATNSNQEDKTTNQEEPHKTRRRGSQSNNAPATPYSSSHPLKTYESKLQRQRSKRHTPRSLLPATLRAKKTPGTKKVSSIQTQQQAHKNTVEPQTSETDSTIATETSTLLQQARELAAALARSFEISSH